MNEAETLSKHIDPQPAAAGWGVVENHFADVNKMVWIGGASASRPMRASSATCIRVSQHPHPEFDN